MCVTIAMLLGVEVVPALCQGISATWPSWDLWDDVDLVVEATVDSVWCEKTREPYEVIRTGALCRVHRVLFGEWTQPTIVVFKAGGTIGNEGSGMSHDDIHFFLGERVMFLLRPAWGTTDWAVGQQRKLAVTPEGLAMSRPGVGGLRTTELVIGRTEFEQAVTAQLKHRRLATLQAEAEAIVVGSIIGRERFVRAGEQAEFVRSPVPSQEAVARAFALADYKGDSFFSVTVSVEQVLKGPPLDRLVVRWPDKYSTEFVARRSPRMAPWCEVGDRFVIMVQRRDDAWVLSRDGLSSVYRVTEDGLVSRLHMTVAELAGRISK
jgi:hypothetical protein